MISKPLLKQSIKANALIWVLVTAATAIMLALIILVLGNIQSDEMRDSLAKTFTQSEIESQLKSGAIDAYVDIYQQVETMYPEAKNLYDLTSESITIYDQLKELGHPNPKEETINQVLTQVPEDQHLLTKMILNQFLAAYEPQTLITEAEKHQFKKTFIITLMLNDVGEDEKQQAAVRYLGNRILDTYIINNQVTTVQLQEITNDFVESIFYETIGQTTSDEITALLEEQGFTNIYEMLTHYEYDQTKVEILVSTGMTQYTSYLNHEMTHEEAKKEVTKSLLSEMPESVGNSLKELGDLNLNHLVIGTIFYKIAGLLLPIVYVITTANSLIAGQVDSGAMAYVLSTPTKRRKVTFTQAIFLIGSLILMYLIIGLTGFVARIFTGPGFEITQFELFQLNVGALVTLISISGICFFTSSWFNRSKFSIGFGGGTAMVFLVSTILGMFGSPVIPGAMKIEAMNVFNYLSIITLFDVTAILEGNNYYIGMLILLGIAILGYLIGALRFDRKDLPL